MSIFLTFGQIIYERAAYHSERYLLPVGFHSSRTYPSMLSPSRRTVYHCTILDGGDVPIVSLKVWTSNQYFLSLSVYNRSFLNCPAHSDYMHAEIAVVGMHDSGTTPEFFFLQSHVV